MFNAPTITLPTTTISHVNMPLININSSRVNVPINKNIICKYFRMVKVLVLNNVPLYNSLLKKIQQAVIVII